METPVPSFDSFRSDVIELATLLVNTSITGDKDLVPMLHARFPTGATTGWPLTQFEDRNLTIAQMQIIVGQYRPTVVGLTFSAWTGARTIEPRKEAAIACFVDREVIEVHEARLVRHDNRASLGAWRKWLLDDFTAPLLTPLQEAMR